MNKLISITTTIIRLGITNVAYVFYYRLSTKIGFRKLFFQTEVFSSKDLFFQGNRAKVELPKEWVNNIIQDANRIVSGEFRYYAYHWKTVGEKPNWFLNPFNGVSYPHADKHWINIEDFNAKVGDIKNVWEASRFEWVVTLSRAYAVTKDEKYLNKLNGLLKDWTLTNPLNIGPNWKCGQEASLRVFALLNSALFLEEYTSPTEAFEELIFNYLKRIAPNINYAIAQDNNHGTSEAAGLFIGGAWLKKYGKSKESQKFGNKCSKVGRRILENRMNKLVEKDGTFSQYSVNYHRLALDTICFVEVWRKILNADNFSNKFYEKARAMTSWMLYFTDLTSGKASNIGANDGALILHFHGCDYRDFRPTCQLASSLFHDVLYFNQDGIWNEPLVWLKQKEQVNRVQDFKKKNTILDGKFLIMNGENSWAILRLPNYKFRPSHNDAFHFDLWCNGENILFDSGSYSYNPGIEYQGIDLKSVHSHNTISFDQQEQMPRIGRFLLGNWLSMHSIGRINEDENLRFKSWSGSYYDSKGNHHKRSVARENNDQWEITDEFSGKSKQVSIGFNFRDEPYKIDGLKLSTEAFNLTSLNTDKLEITDHQHSLYYWAKVKAKRLVFSQSNNGVHKTKIELK